MEDTKTIRLIAWLLFVVWVLAFLLIGYGCYQCEETNREAMKQHLTTERPYLPHGN